MRQIFISAIQSGIAIICIVACNRTTPEMDLLPFDEYHLGMYIHTGADSPFESHEFHNYSAWNSWAFYGTTGDSLRFQEDSILFVHGVFDVFEVQRMSRTPGTEYRFEFGIFVKQQDIDNNVTLHFNSSYNNLATNKKRWENGELKTSICSCDIINKDHWEKYEVMTGHLTFEYPNYFDSYVYRIADQGLLSVKHSYYYSGPILFEMAAQTEDGKEMTVTNGYFQKYTKKYEKNAH